MTVVMEQVGFNDGFAGVEPRFMESITYLKAWNSGAALKEIQSEPDQTEKNEQ